MDICRNENNKNDDNGEVTNTSDFSETDESDIFSDANEYTPFPNCIIMTSLKILELF